jgi:hypothetical protein
MATSRAVTLSAMPASVSAGAATWLTIAGRNNDWVSMCVDVWSFAASEEAIGRRGEESLHRAAARFMRSMASRG